MSRLEEIKTRCDAATPGPWVLMKNGRYEDHDECRIDLSDDTIELSRYDNGEFIAHARDDVPWLLGEVDRTRTEGHRLDAVVRCYKNEYNRLQVRLDKQAERTAKARRQRDEARAEADRLRQENEALRNAGAFDPLEMAKIAIMAQANDQLRAELEAAKNDLKTVCSIIGEPCAVCAYCCNRGDQFPCEKKDEWCGGVEWQWRGQCAGNGGAPHD